MITKEQLLFRLTKAYMAAGSMKAWAEQHGISPQYVSDVRHGYRAPGAKILEALGYEEVVRYAKLEE